MKRFKITLILFAALLVTASCDRDFEEINQDPNNPTSIPSHLLIPTVVRNIQNQMYSTFAGGDMGACWAQQFAKVQYNDEARYIPRQGTIEGIWTFLYSSVISDAVAMYNLADDEENAAMKGVALILQAYTYSVLTDMYGDIPYSESMSTKEGIISPAYDSQEMVYQGVLAKLDEAMALINSGTIDSGSDILYGGDTGAWKKFAASLKFRCLMRISGKVSVGSQLQTLVNSGNLFSSNAEEAKLIYLSSAPNANPLYETIVFGTRGEWKVNSEIVDWMVSENDPRLSYTTAKNDDGEYRGKPSGIVNVPSVEYSYANVSPLGDFYLRPEAPGYFVSYSELMFLKAEAAEKGLISGSPGAFYTAGIQASMDAHGIADDLGYISRHSYQPEFALAQIGREKWLALFAQGIEAWTEQRRTGFPVLQPALEADLNEIPSRYNYPNIESSINAANYEDAVSAQGTDNLTTKVWWNK